MDNNKMITVLRWVALVPILAITHFAILQVPKLFSGAYSNGNLFIVPDTTLGIFLMLVISVFSIFEVWAFIKVGTLVAPKKKRRTSKILALIKIIGVLSTLGNALRLITHGARFSWTIILIVQSILCIITAILCIHKGKDSDNLVRTTPFNMSSKRETQIEIKEPPRVKIPILDPEEKEKDSVVGNILMGIMVLLFIICGCFAIADAIQ